MSGGSPIGDQRHTVNSDKGKVAEKQTATHAKGHGLGYINTVMRKQVGGYPAFTVGGLGMGKIRQEADPGRPRGYKQAV